MKTPFVLAAAAMLLAGLVLVGLSDTVISVDDTSLPDSEASTAVSKAGNCSASATITITMYAVADEQLGKQIWR